MNSKVKKKIGSSVMYLLMRGLTRHSGRLDVGRGVRSVLRFTLRKYKRRKKLVCSKQNPSAVVRQLIDYET